MVKATQLTLTTAVIAALALAFMLAFATPASAFGGYRGGNDGDRTTVRNENQASVGNSVEVKANTGYNGTDSGNGGNGGDADADGGDATGGNGGNGGDSGDIDTGNAEAWGTVSNDVNSNRTVIEGCGCPEEENDHDNPFHWFKKFKKDGDKIEVTNRNRGEVENYLGVKANTGKNGTDSGNGGNGGDAETDDEDGQRVHHFYKWWLHMQDDDEDGDATGGNGGHGGNSGDVDTGDAYADGLVTNVVNRNVTRITR